MPWELFGHLPGSRRRPWKGPRSDKIRPVSGISDASGGLGISGEEEEAGKRPVRGSMVAQ